MRVYVTGEVTMSATGQPERGTAGEARDTGRLEAFSDGVLAIVVTIIVLEIHVPPLTSVDAKHSLLDQLLHQWPIYLAYLTSFLTVFVMWVNHHNIFKQVRKVDQTFLILNGLLLLCIAVVPFTTALLAEYLTHPESRTAILVYNGVYVFVALAFNRMWFYAARNGRLLIRDANAAFVRHTSRGYAIGPLLYLATFAIGAVNTIAGVVANLALAVFFALPSGANREDAADALAATPSVTGTAAN